jgi:D-galactarolactone cycloisomerase
VSRHLLASIEHGAFAECFHPDRDPFWWNPRRQPATVEDGELLPTNAPGLGWDLDPDFIARWMVAR